MLNVDAEGFDYMDRKLLLAVIDKFFGGPVGLDNPRRRRLVKSGKPSKMCWNRILSSRVFTTYSARKNGNGQSVESLRYYAAGNAVKLNTGSRTHRHTI